MAAGSCRPVRRICSTLRWDFWPTLVILLKDFCWNYSELFQSNLPLPFNILWLWDHANLFKETKKQNVNSTPPLSVWHQLAVTHREVSFKPASGLEISSVFRSHISRRLLEAFSAETLHGALLNVCISFFYFEDHKLCVMSGFAIGQRFTQSDIVWIMEGPYFVITLCLLRLMDWPKRELGRSEAFI